MKKYLNWRLWAITLMGVAAVVCIVCDAPTIGKLIAVKLVGLAVAGATWRLGTRWEAEGKIEFPY